RSTNQFPRFADMLKDLPLVGGSFRCDSPRSQLACDMAERHRPPPKGRRRNMRLHFLLPFARQKKSARRNGVEPQKTLDGDSRKCDSLSCDTTEKGFRNLFRWPFSFAVRSFHLYRARLGIDANLTLGRLSLLHSFQEIEHTNDPTGPRHTLRKMAPVSRRKLMLSSRSLAGCAPPFSPSA